MNYSETIHGKRTAKHPILYRITTRIQYVFWWIGIPFHNPYADECTPDFNCCANVGRFVLFRVRNLIGTGYFPIVHLSAEKEGKYYKISVGILGICFTFTIKRKCRKRQFIK